MRKAPGPQWTEGAAERMLVSARPGAGFARPAAGHDLSYRSSFLGDSPWRGRSGRVGICVPHPPRPAARLSRIGPAPMQGGIRARAPTRKEARKLLRIV